MFRGSVFIYLKRNKYFHWAYFRVFLFQNNMLSPDGSPSPISTSAMFPVRTRGVHSDADEENHQVDAPKKDCCTTKMGAADTVDLVSRYLFPCVFVGFNIIYWTKYLWPWTPVPHCVCCIKVPSFHEPYWSYILLYYLRNLISKVHLTLTDYMPTTL